MTKPTKPPPAKSKVDALAAMPTRSLYGKPKPPANVIPIRPKRVATPASACTPATHCTPVVNTMVNTSAVVNTDGEHTSRHGVHKDPEAFKAANRERMRAKRAAAKKG